MRPLFKDVDALSPTMAGWLSDSRNEARAAKRWEHADQSRTRLLVGGWIVKDLRGGGTDLYKPTPAQWNMAMNETFDATKAES